MITVCQAENAGRTIYFPYERASLDQFPAKPVRLVIPAHGVVAHLAGPLVMRASSQLHFPLMMIGNGMP